MVIPVPATAFMDHGSPSPFAIKMRPYCIVLVAVQFAIVVARLILLDPMGMFAMLIPAAFGAYMIKEGMAMRWIQIWGLLNFINAIFDTLMTIVKVPTIIGAIHAGTMLEGHGADSKEVKISEATMGLLWLLLITIILAPVTEIIGSYLAYQMYKEREEEREALFQNQYDQGGFGAAGGYSNYGGASNRNAAMTPNDTSGMRPQSQNFVPFGGEGRTLGASD